MCRHSLHRQFRQTCGPHVRLNSFIQTFADNSGQAMSDTHVAFDVVAAAVAARVLHAVVHTNWVGGAAAGRGHRRGAWWQLCSTLRGCFQCLSLLRWEITSQMRFAIRSVV